MSDMDWDICGACGQLVIAATNIYGNRMHLTPTRFVDHAWVIDETDGLAKPLRKVVLKKPEVRLYVSHWSVCENWLETSVTFSDAEVAS